MNARILHRLARLEDAAPRSTILVDQCHCPHPSILSYVFGEAQPSKTCLDCGLLHDRVVVCEVLIKTREEAERFNNMVEAGTPELFVPDSQCILTEVHPTAMGAVEEESGHGS